MERLWERRGMWNRAELESGSGMGVWDWGGGVGWGDWGCVKCVLV